MSASARASSTLIAGLLFASASSGAVAQLSIPVQVAHEELRIVSNDTIPGMLLTSVGGGTVLPDGRLVTLHPGEGVLRVFDTRGRLLRVVGRKGGGPGEFSVPLAIGYIGDTLWVREESKGYVLFDERFEPAGTLRIKRPGSGLTSPMTVFAWSNAGDSTPGGIFSRDTLVRPIRIPVRVASHRFDVRAPAVSPSGLPMSGTSMRPMTSPLLTATRFGLAPGGREAVVLESAELWGGRPGQFTLRRINTATGQVSAPVTVSLAPRKVRRAEADSLITDAIRGRREIANEYRAKVRVPAVYPAFIDLIVSPDSVLWLTEGGDPNARLMVDFSGKPLMRVKLPPGVRLFTVSRTHAWGVVRDDDDLPIIVRYRLEPGGR